MKIAITGGTGFVGGHLARELVKQGHQVVLIARGHDTRDTAIREEKDVTFVACGLDSTAALQQAFHGCQAVAHCAGINRERGAQTYQAVHIDGTRHVVEAARGAGVQKVLLVSFLRARPDCGSGYHESKFAAEEIVRSSGLDYTILKEGITYGKGDHMISHLGWAMRTLPAFGYVGLRESTLRPVSVHDMVRIMVAALTADRLNNETVAVMGPEEMPLSAAINRVADVVGRRPWLRMPLPIFVHRMLALVWEATMTIPLASRAQVQMLAEGLSQPMPEGTALVPDDLAPTRTLNAELIREALA